MGIKRFDLKEPVVGSVIPVEEFHRRVEALRERVVTLLPQELAIYDMVVLVDAAILFILQWMVFLFQLWPIGFDVGLPGVTMLASEIFIGGVARVVSRTTIPEIL